MRKSIAMACAALAGLLGAAGPAAAHPHVFLSQTVSVVFDRGAIVALDQVWFFDEFYSAMAVEGLDKNKDGKYSREELHPLAKTNMEGLKEFGYYTFPKLAGTELKIADPKETDYWFEFTDGLLSLHFRLPLAQPVLADAKGFEFSVYDPSYFIAFEYKEKGVTVATGAPTGCQAVVAEPEKTAADARRLGESFFEQLGGGAAGISFAKTIKVTCPAQ